MAATALRIYVVMPEAEGAKPRLVRATHPANALRHVANEAFTVSVATQDTLVELLSKGIKVEQISAEQQRID